MDQTALLAPSLGFPPQIQWGGWASAPSGPRGPGPQAGGFPPYLLTHCPQAGHGVVGGSPTCPVPSLCRPHPHPSFPDLAVSFPPSSHHLQPQGVYVFACAHLSLRNLICSVSRALAPSIVPDAEQACHRCVLNDYMDIVWLLGESFTTFPNGPQLSP